MQSNALQQPKEAVQVNGDREVNESDESESEEDSEDEEETTGKEMADSSQEDSGLASAQQVWTSLFFLSARRKLEFSLIYVRRNLAVLIGCTKSQHQGSYVYKDNTAL